MTQKEFFVVWPDGKLYSLDTKQYQTVLKQYLINGGPHTIYRGEQIPVPEGAKCIGWLDFDTGREWHDDDVESRLEQATKGTEM